GRSLRDFRNAHARDTRARERAEMRRAELSLNVQRELGERLPELVVLLVRFFLERLVVDRFVADAEIGLRAARFARQVGVDAPLRAADVGRVEEQRVVAAPASREK